MIPLNPGCSIGSPRAPRVWARPRRARTVAPPGPSRSRQRYRRREADDRHSQAKTLPLTKKARRGAWLGVDWLGEALGGRPSRQGKRIEPYELGAKKAGRHSSTVMPSFISFCGATLRQSVSDIEARRMSQSLPEIQLHQLLPSSIRARPCLYRETSQRKNSKSSSMELAELRQRSGAWCPHSAAQRL